MKRNLILLVLIVLLLPADIFAQGTWVRKEPIPYAVSHASPAVIGNTLYLVGGAAGILLLILSLVLAL